MPNFMIMDISNYENWIAYFESLHKLASYSGIKLNEDLCKNKERTRSFGFTPIKTYPTNIRHFFSKDDQCSCDINDIAKNKITVKCNYID